MEISQVTTAVMVFLTSLLPASCHKTTDAKHQSQQPSAAVVAGPTNAPGAKILERNLGDITMTNNNDFCVQFDNGEYCTLTPKILEQRDVRITLAVESKNMHGETTNFTVKQVITKTGKPVEVSVADLNLTFTPNVVTAE